MSGYTLYPHMKKLLEAIALGKKIVCYNNPVSVRKILREHLFKNESNIKTGSANAPEKPDYRGVDADGIIFSEYSDFTTKER